MLLSVSVASGHLFQSGPVDTGRDGQGQASSKMIQFPSASEWRLMEKSQDRASANPGDRGRGGVSSELMAVFPSPRHDSSRDYFFEM